MSHSFQFRPGSVDEVIFRAVTRGNEYNLPDSFGPDDVIVDVGTHIGSFCHAALQRGAGQVYGFEASPENYACAVRNLEPYGRRVTVAHKAVWRSDRAVPSLYFNDLHPDNNGAGHVLRPSGRPVDVVAFDDVIRGVTGNGRKRVRLLKMDCEGAEYPILLTSRTLHLIDQVVGEYHNFGEGHPEDHPFSRIPEEARVDGYGRFTVDEIAAALRQSGFEVRVTTHPLIPDLAGWFDARRVARPRRVGDRFRWYRDGLRYKAHRLLHAA